VSGKKMEGNEQQRRAAARKAREEGLNAGDVGASQGSSQQHNRATGGESHQERLDRKRQGKPAVIAQQTSEARPGSRDADSADRERYPELRDSDHGSESRGLGPRETRG